MMGKYNTYYNYLKDSGWVYVRFSVDTGHIFKRDDILLSLVQLVDKDISSNIVTHIEFKYSNKRRPFHLLHNTSLDELKNYFRVQKIKKIMNGKL